MPLSSQSPAAELRDASASADDARPLTIPKPRLPWRRIGGSFLLMVGIYWFYALAIVPFIEPTADIRPEYDAAPLVTDGTDVVDQQRKALLPWFSPGDWELTSPKVIESPRGKLLLHEYETLADGRLKIKPCTMIFLHEGEAESEADRNRRAVILQAPEGAILRFDTPVDLRQSKMGKLVGGHMMGPITIRSDQRLPGPQDDLLIKTRDAELIGDKIVTSHPVDFRLGPNRGNGRELEIVLAPSAKPIPNSPAPGFGGVNSVTLKKDVRMRLYPGQADMFPGPATPAERKPQPTPAPDKAADNLPVDITCDGAFQFDVTRFAAIFHKKVDVLRTNADGPSDQLNCEVLSLFFEPAGGAGGPPAPGARRGGLGGNLEPSRVEAEGDPVVIRSPSRGVQARGTRLEYDVKKNAGGMKGPGWMKAERPGDAQARPVEATWQRELEFGPYEGVQCAKLAGDAHVESPGVGLLKAETIRLFMIEDPSTPATDTGRRRLVPDRLQAFERVHFESPTLSGDVHHLQVWLRRPPPSRAVAAVTKNARAVSGPKRPATPPVPATPLAANTSPLSPSAAPNPDGRQIHVAGELLQVEALLGDKSTEVTRIHIERNVVLRELKVAEPGARPMIMRGDQLDVDQPLPNQAVAHIVGNPAHIVAREMTIDGNDIHVDRGNNRAWVNGRGVMTIMVPAGQTAAMQPGAVPASTPSPNQPVGQPRPLEITWKGRMDFDGRDAMFQEGVVVVTEAQKITPEGLPSDEHQRLTCNWLQATFEPRVTFDQANPQARPQIRQVLCKENVALEQRTTVGGKPNSIERLVAMDLRAEPATGNLAANGPGWVRRAWVDTGSGTPRLPGAQPTAPPKQPAPQGPPTKRLVYLGVNFQGLLAGNQTQQAMDFQDRVRCVYSPIPDWDSVVEPDDPDKLADGAILLTSDRLQVVRTAAVAGQGQPFELTATGNAKLDGRAPGSGGDPADPSKPKSRGQTFSASAARLNYAAAKDLFVLEGDGRNYAYLARQERVGAPFDEQSAGKFLFWPSLNQLQVQDAHSLHIQSLESNANRRDRQAPAAPSATAPPAQRR